MRQLCQYGPEDDVYAGCHRTSAIRPAGTMVGNSTLVNPDLRVEIEVDAIVDGAVAAGEPVEEVNLDEAES